MKSLMALTSQRMRAKWQAAAQQGASPQEHFLPWGSQLADLLHAHAVQKELEPPQDVSKMVGKALAPSVDKLRPHQVCTTLSTSPLCEHTQCSARQVHLLLLHSMCSVGKAKAALSLGISSW